MLGRLNIDEVWYIYYIYVCVCIYIYVYIYIYIYTYTHILKNLFMGRVLWKCILRNLDKADSPPTT